jgi:hypothetical protein
MLKCYKCGKPIKTTNALSMYMGETWHKTCFAKNLKRTKPMKQSTQDKNNSFMSRREKGIIWSNRG